MSEGTSSNHSMDNNPISNVSVMEPVGYEQGMQDMRDYFDKMLVNAINNPDITLLPPKMVLQVLLASLRSED